ncbi:MAG: hypothetical protein AAFQ90_10075 [Pseudomonadota bacterium]
MSFSSKRPNRSLTCAIVTVFALTCAACSKIEVETCAARPMQPGKTNQGFELIDLGKGQVWATKDWDTEAFNAFTLPLDWSMWRKNDPRTRASTQGQFLRSPGCEPGGFTYMTAFGREFLHVVDLKTYGETLEGTQDLIRSVSLTKHHEVIWEAGAPIQVLTDPEGLPHFLVARTTPIPADGPTVPEGWRLKTGVLAEPFTLSLDGAVTVLRMDNEDAFQRSEQGQAPLVWAAP